MKMSLASGEADQNQPEVAPGKMTVLMAGFQQRRSTMEVPNA